MDNLYLFWSYFWIGLVVFFLGFLVWFVFVKIRIPKGATAYNAPKLQSLPIPGSEKKGSTAIRRNLFVINKDLVGSGVTSKETVVLPNVYSSLDVWNHAKKTYPDRDCLGYRTGPNSTGPYQFIKYSKVAEDAENLGKSLVHLASLKEQDTVGIYSINRPEWAITGLACSHQNLISIALYDTLGADAVRFILQDASITFVLTSKVYMAKLLEAIVALGDKNTVRVIIQMEDIDENEFNAVKNEFGRDLKFIHSIAAWSTDVTSSPSNTAITTTTTSKETKEATTSNIPIKLVDWKTAITEGKNITNIPASRKPKPSDIYTISYTSGTTGVPKGVVIEHRVVASFINGAIFNETNFGSFDPKLRWLLQDKQDIWISYLPLAHVMERALQELLFYAGAAIGFYGGDTAKILDDVAELKPTIFASVPRLFNRVYSRAMAALNAPDTPKIRKLLFQFCYSRKLELMKMGYLSRDTIWDTLVFKKIQQRLGGRVRMVVTGSAPIAPYILDWFRTVFGVTVVEGYGLTETFAGLCSTRMDYFVGGNVGIPSSTVEIKLMDVKDSVVEYLASENKGEICVRGTTLFSGYHGRPDLTKEVMDEDGFFHTGDIGRLNEDGTLTIIDRKKNIFKLSQGEYVSPEKLENIFCRSAFVTQVFVHGSSTESSLVAVVVPDIDYLRSWAKGIPNAFPNSNSSNLSDVSDEMICSNKHCIHAVLNNLTEIGKLAQLKGFEFVKAVHLEPSAFTVQSGLLTPSFKLIRTACQKKYTNVITNMYQTISTQSTNHADK